MNVASVAINDGMWTFHFGDNRGSEKGFGFEGCFSPNERDALIALCKSAAGANYFDGPCLRLDSYSNEGGTNIVSLSEVAFFDFLTSNYLLFQRESLLRVADKAERGLLNRLFSMMDDIASYSVSDVLDLPFLSNVLAVSLLMKDKSGRYLISKRSSTVGIASGYYAATVTGSLEPVDLEASNPIKHCCARECLEELDLVVDDDEIVVNEIVVGRDKFQPIVLAEVLVEDAEAVACHAIQGEDYSLENSGMRIMRASDLRAIAEDSTSLVTRATRYQFEVAGK